MYSYSQINVPVYEAEYSLLRLNRFPRPYLTPVPFIQFKAYTPQQTDDSLSHLHGVSFSNFLYAISFLNNIFKTLLCMRQEEEKHYVCCLVLAFIGSYTASARSSSHLPSHVQWLKLY